MEKSCSLAAAIDPWTPGRYSCRFPTHGDDPPFLRVVINDVCPNDAAMFWCCKSQQELALNTGCFYQMQILLLSTADHLYIFQYEQMWSAASSMCERIPVSPPVSMLASLNTNTHTWCEESWSSCGWGSVALLQGCRVHHSNRHP